MNLYFKFFCLIIKRLFSCPPQGLKDVAVTDFRVGLLDLDLNFHMNNGRFLSIMDLGRFDMLIKAGHFKKLFKNGYYPIVLSEAIIFKKSLTYFSKYEVHTQIESWDDKFFYLTQKFIFRNTIVASASVRACFKNRTRKGIVKPKEIFEFLEEDYEEVKPSDLVKRHIDIDNTLLPRS